MSTAQMADSAANAGNDCALRCSWLPNSARSSYRGVLCTFYLFVVDLVVALGDDIWEDGVHIGAVAFSDSATPLLGGRFLSDPDLIIATLAEDLIELESRVPTRMYTAFELLQSTYFKQNELGRYDSQYRDADDIQLQIVVLSDGRSINPKNILEDQLSTPPFDAATRLMFSVAGSQNPYPGQFALIDTTVDAADAVPPYLACVPKIINSTDPMVDRVVQAIETQNCLTTPTTTLTGSSTPTTTGSTTGTTFECLPNADIVFIIDSSSNLANDELNQARAFQCFKNFTTNAILGLRRAVKRHRFQVAAVTFADEPRIEFDFREYSLDRAGMIQHLKRLHLPAFESGIDGTFSEAGKAFTVVREQLLTPLRGHTDPGTPAVVVALTDGHVRADRTAASSSGACVGLPDDDACGELLLEQELGRPEFQHNITMRWAFGTPTLDTIHADLRAFRAKQLETMKRGSDVYAETGQRDACAPEAVESFVQFMLESDDVRRCPEDVTTSEFTTASSTPSSTMSVTATTSPTTTVSSVFPCAQRRADLVLLFDTSVSASQTLESPDCAASCPPPACLGPDLAVDVIRAIESFIRRDGVRVALVAFSNTVEPIRTPAWNATAFSWNVEEIIEALHMIPTILPRQPTRAATAFEVLDQQYFGSEEETGFRGGDAPIVFITMSDARSEGRTHLEKYIKENPSFSEARRMLFSFEGAESPLPGQYEIFDNTDHDARPEPMKLGCPEGPTVAFAEDALPVVLNAEAVKEALKHIGQEPCVSTFSTTATSTATTDVHSSMAVAPTVRYEFLSPVPLAELGPGSRDTLLLRAYGKFKERAARDEADVYDWYFVETGKVSSIYLSSIPGSRGRRDDGNTYYLIEVLFTMERGLTVAEVKAQHMEPMPLVGSCVAGSKCTVVATVALGGQGQEGSTDGSTDSVEVDALLSSDAGGNPQAGGGSSSDSMVFHLVGISFGTRQILVTTTGTSTATSTATSTVTTTTTSTSTVTSSTTSSSITSTSSSTTTVTTTTSSTSSSVSSSSTSSSTFTVTSSSTSSTSSSTSSTPTSVTRTSSTGTTSSTSSSVSSTTTYSSTSASTATSTTLTPALQTVVETSGFCTTWDSRSCLTMLSAALVLLLIFIVYLVVWCRGKRGKAVIAPVPKQTNTAKVATDDTDFQEVLRALHGVPREGWSPRQQRPQPLSPPPDYRNTPPGITLYRRPVSPMHRPRSGFAHPQPSPRTAVVAPAKGPLLAPHGAPRSSPRSLPALPPLRHTPSGSRPTSSGYLDIAPNPRR